MMASFGIEPWDDAAMTESLMNMVCGLPRVRLDRLDAPKSPGAYLQFTAVRQTLPILGLVADGRYPAYAGVASISLRERLGRYRQNLRGVENLTESDIYIALLPCSSAGSALFAEAALIEQLNPLLQRFGWGAKMPGDKRGGTKCSAFDALVPGRRWAPTPTLIDQACAQLRVVAYLAALDPAGPRWPSLEV